MFFFGTQCILQTQCMVLTLLAGHVKEHLAHKNMIPVISSAFPGNHLIKKTWKSKHNLPFNICLKIQKSPLTFPTRAGAIMLLTLLTAFNTAETQQRHGIISRHLPKCCYII